MLVLSRLLFIKIIVLLAIVHDTTASFNNTNTANAIQSVATPAITIAVNNLDVDLKHVETRRQKQKKSKKQRSTSSSSGERKGGTDSSHGESLELSSSASSTSGSKNKKERDKKDEPKSSAERKGWRKWHRKCPRCPEDMAKKWRDPSINWICGGYQRARRSFKSLCMMHYRNCQDGTMFVKIHDHRCANDTTRSRRVGDHFFYEYKVRMSESSSKSGDTTTSSSDEEGSTYSDDDTYDWRRVLRNNTV